MPQHKSCEKRLKQDVKRNARNRAGVSNLRQAVRKYRELEAGKRPAEYAAFQSLLDRLKSRLAPATQAA